MRGELEMNARTKSALSDAQLSCETAAARLGAAWNALDDEFEALSEIEQMYVGGRRISEQQSAVMDLQDRVLDVEARIKTMLGRE